MKLNTKQIILSACIGLAGCTFLCFTKGENRTFQIAKNLDILNAAYKELDMFYVDTIEPEKVIKYGIDAMLAQTDPYTMYFPEEDKSLKEMITGKFGGVGSYIRFYKKKDRIAIVEPSEGSPAAKMGLKAGDVILEVNGKDFKCNGKVPNVFSDEVSGALRGEPGTVVKIKVERPIAGDTTEIKEFSITRQTIKTKPVPYYGMVNDSVGLISLTTFAVDGCAKDVKKALIELKQQGAKSLVLDLRQNGGGALDEAVEIVNLFVPKDLEVVSTRGKIKQAGSLYKTTNEPVDVNIPMAVLVDGASASASEICAGALQDLDRAVIIGSRTFGKGLVQIIRNLPYNSSMKVTTAKYYIPSGRCVQAIDYSKRNADGSLARTPDSLTNVFHTKAGREVRDGGGIRPDVEVKAERFPNILFYLMNDDVIFDYATKYCISHATIPEVKKFEITEADFKEFKEMVKARKFTYDRQSEKILKDLKDVAEFEGYMDGAKAEFEALEKKLSHNLDKELDLI